jgi:hypothetical protein
MTDSLIEDIENNAAKYDDSRDNLKERFIDVCNKENMLGATYTENEMKKFKLVMNVIKEHIEFMDSLPSVKPIPISNKK